ncbi:MAG TPA: metalloregulator ArsR/SmtB family transcription factor [Verrucomicrobiae bacterium]|nr:metalloregulator ArsR/SmtB family transcription factor [Verrucomicrobiae bacterium]
MTKRALHSRPRSGDVFRCLADPSRRKMLALLARGELPLNRITARFDMSRPAVIKHLLVLRSANLVVVRRQGRERIHHLNPAPLRAVETLLSKFEMFWENSLQKLKRQVESDL